MRTVSTENIEHIHLSLPASPIAEKLSFPRKEHIDPHPFESILVKEFANIQILRASEKDYTTKHHMRMKNKPALHLHGLPFDST
jgi:hypothetical protein